MGTAELVLNFPGPDKVNVSFDGTDSGQLEFTNPITVKDRSDIRWYVETYGARSLADPDDKDARRIEERLPEIGKALFDSIFTSRPAQRVFNRFQDDDSANRVVTIHADDAAVLSLPWELLHDPEGEFFIWEQPHVSVRRTIAGDTRGRTRFQVKPKDVIHVLFVVSRPEDAGFIDPRSDPAAVMDAIDAHAPGRVTTEFLWPATVNALKARLADKSQPAIDILHFDGHGVFRQVSAKDVADNPGLFGKSIESEIQRERQSRAKSGHSTAVDGPVGIGFLVFENEQRKKHLITADEFAKNLHRSKVGLVVLSACESAKSDDSRSDPLASVAGRLTATGIPAILAMTHSVLVATTRALFAEFYRSLTLGHGIAASLDDARVYLANNPQKYEVQRGQAREMLRLQDWFVPALFHAGADTPLLTPIGDFQPSETTADETRPLEATATKHNLRPQHEAGFFGRRRELWDIEYWFGTGQTRRISITGFGGQGKTELALEAGRWLLRTGMFRQAVFVDYAGVQSLDAVAAAVSTIGAALGETLIDADAVSDLLAKTPTLVILDNLETIPTRSLALPSRASDNAAESSALESQATGELDPLHTLLDAAKGWSEAGDSRVLLTSRIPDSGHPDFAIAGTFKHRRIVLEGLGSAAYPDDALDWFVQLNRLPSAEPRQVPPPKRDELIALFGRVRFHPLSICVLVQQLKTRTAKQLNQRLEELLSPGAISLIAIEGTPDSLIASLRLSLEQLSEDERLAVRRLGVFQGGAFEDDLLAITGLGESDEREQLQLSLAAAERKATIWPTLRRSLEEAALIEAERVPGVDPPFLRFHPTLAAMLWSTLDADEHDALLLAHRQRYYALANYLYHEDMKNPHMVRAIARRELPNLLHAVHQALDAADPDAVQFVDCVNRFLNVFGMTREAASLARRAEQAGGERGSRAWFLAQSGRGEQLLAAGNIAVAAEIFTDILQTLGDQPSYELALTLGRLGRCYKEGGRPDLPEATYRQGIAVTQQLEQSDRNRRHRAALQTDLAELLADQGKYQQARGLYKLSREIVTELNDLRSQGVIIGQLGTLAMMEGDLAEAVRHNHEALALFQCLGEPAGEAIYHHQLGRAYQKSRQWEPAEHHYRESARLKEQQGNLAGAAQTWNNLATLNQSNAKLEAAETWYRKAIEGSRQSASYIELSRALNNLADLLRTQPGRLDKARQLAEESLSIVNTLDPDAMEIWKFYVTPAKIADQQGDAEQAAEYRRLAREAKRKFAGTAHEMTRFAPVIAMVVEAVSGNEQAQAALSPLMQQLQQAGGENADLADAIQHILTGERDTEALCQSAGPTASLIIETILAAIDDPTTLADLLPGQ
ncbi:MAG TPA: CHAT domain-containing protein [Pirellulaceae bacterium]|nr:CHAT domain-containing protein [Pirellulaceae bacterium]